MHIAVDDVRAATLRELLTFFAPDIEIAWFPAWDCLPYDRVSPNADIIACRVLALGQLLDWKADGKYLPRVLVTTVNAASQRVTPASRA